MRFSIAVAALVSFVVPALAADFPVKVGDGGLVFNPTFVQVQDGDTVTFSFLAKNHSVTQSTFANPCQRQTTPQLGVDSGFQAIPPTGLTGDPPQWRITITNASAPLWFYCAQTAPANHCQAGMVFAINPTAEKSFDAYLANAKASTGGAAPAPSGGAAPTGASSSGAAPTVGAPTLGGGAIPTSSGAIPTGNIPTAAPGVSETISADPSQTSAPGNGAVRIGSSAAGLLSLALAAFLL